MTTAGSKSKLHKQASRICEDALAIMATLGVPIADLTPRRRERVAKVFLAVSGLKPGMKWSELKSSADGYRLTSRKIIRFLNEHLGESIADSSYDDIRRKDLIWLVQAGIVLDSAGRLNTNDGTRSYGLDSDFAEQIRAFGSLAWQESLPKFMSGRLALAEDLRRKRNLHRIPVKIGESEYLFGPGDHNLLQKAIIVDFLPLFGRGAEVLYVGDADDRSLFLKSEKLRSLGFFEIKADKLPDVLAYSQEKNWLFVIEAVHAANPISELRRRTLEALTLDCKADIVYVTAFSTRKSFGRFAKEIAWETEVWIAEAPEHLIHYNGDKFIGPHRVAST